MARKKKLDVKQYQTMTDEQRAEVRAELARGYAEACFRTAIRTGAVEPQGKSEAELHLELLDYALNHLDKVGEAGDIWLVVDHTKELLKEARRNRRKRKYEFAVLLYATWSEHWLNSTIRTACERKDMKEDTCECVVRDASFRAKSTWVLELVGLPALPPEALGALQELQNLRNGFVHYKFKSRNEAGMAQHRQQIQAAAERGEELVRDLTNYENKHIFNRRTRSAARLARQLGQSKQSELKPDSPE